VYRALAPWMKTNGHKLSVVGGTSIGAINASVITARHGDPDHGVAALTGLWQSLSEGSALFLPPLESFKSVNAVWTSLLFGNPRMFPADCSALDLHAAGHLGSILGLL
jgi:predicted acylesterase/phospholipase RssA